MMLNFFILYVFPFCTRSEEYTEIAGIKGCQICSILKLLKRQIRTKKKKKNRKQIMNPLKKRFSPFIVFCISPFELGACHQLSLYFIRFKQNYSFLLSQTRFSRNPRLKAAISPTEMLILGARKVVDNHKNKKLVSIVELSNPESPKQKNRL